MTIADMYSVHQRAQMKAIYILIVNMGSFLAPVTAGYCSDSMGSRWMWRKTTTTVGVCLTGIVPPFIGGVIALGASGSTDGIFHCLAKRNGGILEPEMRLDLALSGVLLAPTDLLLYGLASAEVVAKPYRLDGQADRSDRANIGSYHAWGLQSIGQASALCAAAP